MAVVQVVLFFRYETWVLTPRLDKALEGFHHQKVQRIMGMAPKHQKDGTWVYPLIGSALVTVGVDDIRVYIACLQNTVAQYIVDFPIMNLCLAE